MSSASSSSSLSAAIPFKLIESINETLVNQSPKAALNLCEKYLKKKSDSHHLQAIRAYLMAQCGKEVEADKAARELLNLANKDQLLTSTLSRVFSLIGDHETSSRLLSDLFKNQPNLDTGFELFEQQLKSVDLKKAFPVALKLSSMANEPSFLAWALAILYADHCHSISRDPSWANVSMLERVAEKVRQSTIERKERISKLTDSEEDQNLKADIESRQVEELRLLVNTYCTLKDIPMAQECLDDLIALIEFKNASPSDRCIVYRYYLDTQQAEKAEKCAENLLREFGLQDWSLWKLLTDSIDVKNNVSRLSELIESISEKSNNRAIILAKLFVANASGNMDNIKDGLVAYLTAFPNGMFQAVDVRVIFQDAEESVKSEIAEICRAHAKDSEESRITWLTCADVLSPPKDETAESTHKSAMYDIVKLASNGDVSSLKQAQEMMNKESGLPSDVTPYSFVLFQIVLCMLLGDFKEALQLFRLLEVKMIQLDTLIYLVSDHVFSFGLYEIGEALFEENFQMYNLAQKEMSDGLFKSFKKGQYTLAIEYLRFMKRVDSSIQSLACVSGSIWSKVMKNAVGDISASLDPLVSDDIILDENEINKCSDNRDRTIFSDIDPTGRLRRIYDENLPTFTTPQYYYRIVLCLVLHALIKSNGQAESIEKHINVLEKIDLDKTERSIIAFAKVCHIPYSQEGDLLQSYSEAFDAAIANVEQIASEAITPHLPYHFVAKCSKLYEYLRTLSLLLAAPLSAMAKPKKAAMKARLHDQIEKLQSLIKKCREVINKYEVENQQEKCSSYIHQISSLLEPNCMAIL